MSERRILVVDDEPQLLRALTTTLRGAGYAVESALTGEGALALAASSRPDAIILDLVLPDLSGVEVCRELRRWSSVPVLILSAVGDEAQKVAALDAGADDYVTKPFGVAELLARLRASLRRVTPSEEPVVTVGELVLDLERSTLTVSGKPVQLTRTEFALLALLARHAGKLFTHRAMLREVWGPEYQNEAQYLHVHISHLRAKIEPDRARPRYILTEPGAGYRMVAPDAVAPGADAAAPDL
jgi:two-component system, OmpR family, KDP operon response regulator KdpE